MSGGGLYRRRYTPRTSKIVYLIFDHLRTLLIAGEPPRGNIDPLLMAVVAHCSRQHILLLDAGWGGYG